MWIAIGYGAYALLAVGLVLLLLMSGARPGKMIAWLMVLLLVPVLGMLLYLMIGLNRRELHVLRGKRGGPHVDYLPEPLRGEAAGVGGEAVADAGLTAPERAILGEAAAALAPEATGHPHLARLIAGNSGFAAQGGNRVELLRDGPATRAALRAAIRSARAYVHVEYYILELGEWLDELLADLAERRRAGVEVRVVYDGLGSLYALRRLRARLDELDLAHAVFLPVKVGRVAATLNYRNHRKIVVVDGEIAFTGGINVSDKYHAAADELGVWRDLHLRVEGPAVRDLHAVFAHDWQRAAQDGALAHPRYFPRVRPRGPSAVQVVAGDPDTDFAATRQAYFALVTRARERVRAINSYVVPDLALLEAFRTAALGGVDVRLLVPAKSDSAVVKWAVRANFEDLLEAGVRIYLYPAAFVHAKAVTADGAVASVGTANLDVRSFEQNYEVNAVVYDAALAADVDAYFDELAADSAELDYETFLTRPRGERLREGLARLASPML